MVSVIVSSWSAAAGIAYVWWLQLLHGRWITLNFLTCWLLRLWTVNLSPKSEVVCAPLVGCLRLFIQPSQIPSTLAGCILSTRRTWRQWPTVRRSILQVWRRIRSSLKCGAFRDDMNNCSCLRGTPIHRVSWVLLLRVWRVLCNEFVRTYVRTVCGRDGFTGDAHINGTGCERYCRVVPPFACNTACVLLAIHSYKFWTVSSAILCHPSWRTSSSCLRDDGGGTPLVTVLTKTDHSILMIFKSDNCAGQGRCWSVSSCCSNQDWTLLAVCVCKLSSWKNYVNVRKQHLVHRMQLVTHNVHVDTGSNSTIHSNYRTSRIPR
jgi:hypothetical protein